MLLKRPQPQFDFIPRPACLPLPDNYGHRKGNLYLADYIHCSSSHGAADRVKRNRRLVETSTQLRRLVEQFTVDSRKSGNGWNKSSHSETENEHERASA